MNKIENIINLIEKQLKDEGLYKIKLGPDYIYEKYKDPLKVLITIIISIRLREEKTLEVADRLFSKYKSFEELKNLSLDKLKEEIKDIGLYNQKAIWIKDIIDRWDYNKACDEEYIRSLPGVGRKVANVYLSYICNYEYIAVDTHVHRIFNRIGIINTRNPEESEKELYKVIPKDYWRNINRIGVLFGKYICKPIKPECNKCYIREYCKYNKKEK